MKMKTCIIHEEPVTIIMIRATERMLLLRRWRGEEVRPTPSGPQSQSEIGRRMKAVLEAEWTIEI